MNTEKVVKEAKVIAGTSLIIGIILLATGILLILMDSSMVSNNRAFIGLSLIPLSLAFVYFTKFRRIQKFPQNIRGIIQEVDERLVALKNEADAKSFKVLQGALFLTYMGYTLFVPEDIFESVGWWILMCLVLLSFFSSGILSSIIRTDSSKEIPNDESTIEPK